MTNVEAEGGDPAKYLTVPVESGIFTEKGPDGEVVYMDRAVVGAILRDGRFVYAMSHGVEFPTWAVEETKSRIAAGEKDLTVGMVLQEHGRVHNHKDPHIDLTGVSRTEQIRETAVRLFQILREIGEI